MRVPQGGYADRNDMPRMRGMLQEEEEMAIQQRALLNDELSVAIPGGFHVMDGAEEQRVFMENARDRWAIWNTHRHIIISIMWNESNKLVSKFVNTKDLIKRIENKAHKSYKANDYQCGEIYETQLCGEPAHGLCYEYVIQDVGQVSEVLVFKHETCCYTIYYYARKDDAEESRKVFQELLDSLELTEE